jgi:hypothetical protein
LLVIQLAKVREEELVIVDFLRTTLTEIMLANIVYHHALNKEIETTVHVDDKPSCALIVQDTASTEFPLADLFEQSTALAKQVNGNWLGLYSNANAKTLKIRTELFDGDLLSKWTFENMSKYLRAVVDLQKKYCVALMDTKAENTLVHKSGTLTLTDFGNGLVLLHRQTYGKWHVLTTQTLCDMSDTDKVLCLLSSRQGDLFQTSDNTLCMLHRTPAPYNDNQGSWTTASNVLYQQFAFSKNQRGEISGQIKAHDIDASVKAAPKTLTAVAKAYKGDDSLRQLLVPAAVAKTLMVNCFRCDMLNALFECQVVGYKNNMKLWDNVATSTNFDAYYDAL